MNNDIKKELLSFEPSTLIVLFEIKLKDENNTPIGYYRFHAGENSFQKSIKYGDGVGKHEYFYIPCKAEGFDFSEDTLPRPTLTFDNTDGFFSLKTRYFKDFVGFDVKRKKTFVKFLHDSNFPNNKNPFGTGNESSYPDEEYSINKKNMENSDIISFEMVSKFEKEGGLIPARRIRYNVCPWQYRNVNGCGYSGKPIATKEDNLLFSATSTTYNKDTTYNLNNVVSLEIDGIDHYFVCMKNGTKTNPLKDKVNWKQDMCSKSVYGCRLRFGNPNNSVNNVEASQGLPFGGFPGAFSG